MKTVNATEAKTKFGELLDAARTEPVTIQKNGRDVAVLVSKEAFDKASKRGVNPKVIQYHEESIRQFEGSYRKLAE